MISMSIQRLVALVFLACVAKLVFIVLGRRRPSRRVLEGICPDSPESVDPDLIDINETEPTEYRPFKPRYHLTMGLMKASYQDWIGLDKKYSWYTSYRQKLHENHWDRTNLVVEEKCTARAVVELYTRVLRYLCTKYPHYFVIGDEVVYNKLRGTELPLSRLHALGSKRILAMLAENTQEDYLLLEFDPAQQEYVCKAMTASFPTGFDPLEKLNKKLTDIHAPNVPGYEQKLKKSMNKYFERLKYPHIAQRLNWSVQSRGAQLHSPSSNHATPDEKLVAYTVDDLDFDSEVFMRVERQLLSRLPDSGFLLFTVRTNLTQIKQLKAEGHAEAFCAAIDGTPEDMAQYKCIPQWGDAVKEYMRC